MKPIHPATSAAINGRDFLKELDCTPGEFLKRLGSMPQGAFRQAIALACFAPPGFMVRAFFPSGWTTDQAADWLNERSAYWGIYKGQSMFAYFWIRVPRTYSPNVQAEKRPVLGTYCSKSDRVSH